MDSREGAKRISPSLTEEPKRNSTEEAGNVKNTQTATTLEKAATGSTEEDEAKPKTKKTTIDFREGCMQRDHSLANNTGAPRPHIGFVCFFKLLKVLRI